MNSNSVKQLISLLTSKDSNEANEVARELNSIIEHNAPELSFYLSKIFFEEFSSFENAKTALTVLASIIKRNKDALEVVKSAFIPYQFHEKMISSFPNEYSHLASIILQSCNEEESQVIYCLIESIDNIQIKELFIEEITSKNYDYDFNRILASLYQIFSLEEEPSECGLNSLVNIVSIHYSEIDFEPFIEQLLSKFSCNSLIALSRIGKYIPTQIAEKMEQIWQLIHSSIIGETNIKTVYSIKKFLSFLYKHDLKVPFEHDQLFSYLIKAFCAETTDEPDNDETITLRQVASEAIDSLISVVEAPDTFLAFIEENSSFDDANMRELCIIVTNSLILHHRPDILEFATELATQSFETEFIRLKIASCWLLHTIIMLHGVDGIDFDCSSLLEIFTSAISEEESLATVCYECIIACIRCSNIDFTELFTMITSQFPISDLPVELQAVRTLEELVNKEEEQQIIIEAIPHILEFQTNDQYICRILSKVLEKIGSAEEEVIQELFQYLSSLEIDTDIITLITDLFIFSGKVFSFDIFFTNITESEEMLDTTIDCLEKLSKTFDISAIIVHLLELFSTFPKQSILDIFLSIQDNSPNSFDCYIDQLLSLLSSVDLPDVKGVITFLGELSLTLNPEESAKVISFGVSLMNESETWDQETISNFVASNEEVTQSLSRELGFQISLFEQ